MHVLLFYETEWATPCGVQVHLVGKQWARVWTVSLLGTVVVTPQKISKASTHFFHYFCKMHPTPLNLYNIIKVNYITITSQ